MKCLTYHEIILNVLNNIFTKGLSGVYTYKTSAFVEGILCKPLQM